jgi:outer membrane protease
MTMQLFKPFSLERRPESASQGELLTKVTRLVDCLLMFKKSLYAGFGSVSLIVACLSSTAPVQAGELKFDGAVIGFGVGLSTGQTDWNKTAPGGGDPTSELTYDETDLLSFELYGRLPLPEKFFIRGNVGIGIKEIGDGNFRDDDWNSNQVLISSTDSIVPDSDMFYVSADVGREVAKFEEGRGSLSLFAGFQYWREKHEAFGVFNRLTNTQTISNSIPVIRNEVEWKSLRLGALGFYKMTDKLTWSADLAFIPYTDMHNEDSHLLRTSMADLGPTPNVVMDGYGHGFEGEIGFAYNFTPNWMANFDVRYWTLMSDGDLVHGPNSTTPSTHTLNDLDTYRYGVNAGVSYVF